MKYLYQTLKIPALLLAVSCSDATSSRTKDEPVPEPSSAIVKESGLYGVWTDTVFYEFNLYTRQYALIFLDDSSVAAGVHCKVDGKDVRNAVFKNASISATKISAYNGALRWAVESLFNCLLKVEIEDATSDYYVINDEYLIVDSYKKGPAFLVRESSEASLWKFRPKHESYEGTPKVPSYKTDVEAQDYCRVFAMLDGKTREESQAYCGAITVARMKCLDVHNVVTLRDEYADIYDYCAKINPDVLECNVLAYDNHNVYVDEYCAKATAGSNVCYQGFFEKNLDFYAGQEHCRNATLSEGQCYRLALKQSDKRFYWDEYCKGITPLRMECSQIAWDGVSNWNFIGSNDFCRNATAAANACYLVANKFKMLRSTNALYCSEASDAAADCYQLAFDKGYTSLQDVSWYCKKASKPAVDCFRLGFDKSLNFDASSSVCANYTETRLACLNRELSAGSDWNAATNKCDSVK